MHFKSGDFRYYELLDKETKTIENTIDRGGWSSVDPIVTAYVNTGGVAVALTGDPPKAVEARSYTINPDGTLTRNNDKL